MASLVRGWCLRVVGIAELVHMRHVVRLRNGRTHGPKIQIVAGDMQGSAQAFEKGLRNAFDPDVQPVGAGRNSVQHKCIGRVGDGVERGGQSDDHSAHLRVNITENIRDAFALKCDGLARSSFIKAQIEAFAFKKREHVVIERIGVGKLDNGANRDYLQMRNEMRFFCRRV